MAEKRWKSRKTVKFSGGGPQFQSGFEQWCKNRMSKHELSSSYNVQSNGHAEQAVKTVKGILKKTDKKQWFCGYCQRTAAPAAPYAYKRVSDDKLVLNADRGGKLRQNKKDIIIDPLLNLNN